MKEFWALVSNTRGLKRIKKDDSFRSTLWWKIYVGFFCVLAVGALCYGIYSGAINPSFQLILIPLLLLLAFIHSLAAIKREWSGQTASWWLTLPYPRSELLLAKLVGIYIRFLEMVVWSMAILILIAVAGVLLNPILWTTQVIGGLTVAAVKDYLLIATASPLVIVLGMLLAVIRHSRLRPLIPPIWILIILLISLLFSGKAMAAILPPSYLLFIRIVVSLLLSAIIFGVTSYILQEQTEL